MCHIIFLLSLMIAPEKPGERLSRLSIEKLIFNYLAYRLEGNDWIRVQKAFIDGQFDSKSSTGISKVKIKGQKGFENTYVVKVTANQKDYFYSTTQELQLKWILHIINNKVSQITAPLSPTPYINVCFGIIFKKSSFLGEWEKSYVMITQDGLTAAKDEKAKCELEILGVKQMWTRFQFIEEKKFMVLKVRDFFKYEFGIPVEAIEKWITAFYSLLRIQ